MKPLTIKRIIQVFIIIALLGLFALMSSCTSNKGLCSGPPSIGNQSTKQVMKYYRNH